MSVVLADGQYRVAKRSHPEARDAHGTPLPSTPGTPSPPLPGAATLQADGTWTLRLDPSTWQVREGDVITDNRGRTWLVTGALLHRNAAVSDVDYVGIRAVPREPVVP